MKLINFAHGAFLTVGGYSALRHHCAGLESAGGSRSCGSGRSGAWSGGGKTDVQPLVCPPADAILATWGLGIIHWSADTIGSGRKCSLCKARRSGAINFMGQYSGLHRLLLVAAALLLAVLLIGLMYFTRWTECGP